MNDFEKIQPRTASPAQLVLPSFFNYRWIWLLGCLVVFFAGALFWYLPESATTASPARTAHARRAETPKAGAVENVTVAGEATVQTANASSGVPSTTSATKPVSREMDPAVNPYAAGLREPGKSKRKWDAAYINTFRQAKEGDPVQFELTDGVMAEGTVKIVQSNNGVVTYVSGVLEKPENGKFFFLTPPAGGKAGKAVGVVEFPESDVAYRVEPTGPNGDPELWRRHLEEVVCKNMAEADPSQLEAAEDGHPEEAYPLRPDAAPDYVPGYNSGIVSLQSLPGAQGVMLLDFAGGYTSSWGGVAYARPNVSNDTIKDIWKRVAEDYMPFNINVTTDIKVFLAAPAASRQRCCYTTTPITAAGVAYIGSWNWGNDTVCWSVYYVGKAAAEVGSHEVGHTLGLGHMGKGADGYYTGQGGGETGWVPIMGAGYYLPMSTWAKGEYADPTNTQDELVQMTTANNNFGYRSDDTGDTLAASRYLDVSTISNNVFAEGVIERAGDTDTFQFTTTGGAVSLTGRPVAPGDWGNLALMATLADSTGTVIATANVQSSVSATISTTLAAGTYTFSVTGVGKNDPMTNGFSNYASLGYYSISGSVVGARKSTSLSVFEHAANSTVVGTVPATNPNASPLVYSIAGGNTGTTFSIDNNGVVRVANNALLDYESLVTNQSLYNPRFELFVNITNTNNAAFNETNRRVLIDVRRFQPRIPAYVIAAADTGTRIRLSWGESPSATRYNIKRSTSPGGPYTTVATTPNSSYSDSGLTLGVTYYYVVSAVNSNGESANSAEASAKTQSVAGFSFESPSISGHVYLPTGSPWTFGGTGSGDAAGMLTNGSAFGNPNAPDGSQAAFVQKTGTITQTFSGFEAGTNYVVVYSAAQRSGAAQHGGETWDVQMDGNVIQSNTPGSTNYTTYTAAFTATSTYHTISFVGTNLNGDDNTVFIDNVQISIAPPAIPNFGFETPNIGTGTPAFRYSPTGASWTFSTQTVNNGAGIVGNGSAFSNATAPQGTQGGFVQATGSLTQSISGFIPGRIYTLSFAAAQRPGPIQNGGQTWDVKINNTTIQSYNTPGGTSYANYSATFTASAATQTLAFVGTNLNGGDNTVFIDNIALSTPLQSTSAGIALTSPANNATFLTPGTVTIAASVTANGTLVTGVEFYVDSVNLVGSSNTAPYTFDWTNPGPGYHNVHARVLFNNGSYADSASARILVLNSNKDLSFETPSVGNNNFQYNPSGGSWTFGGTPGNGCGIVANGSGFGNPNATAGSQAAFVQGISRVYQTLSGFTPGNIYSITYAAAQRGGGSQHGGQSWDVMIDDTVIKSNLPGSTSYTTQTATFAPSSTVHTLSFAGTNLSFDDNTVFLDNVVIAIAVIPPTGLTATYGNSQNTLNWTASAGATSYNVKRALVSGGPYTTVTNVATPGYVDTGLTNGTTCYYVVTAVKDGWETANSNEASATPQNVMPSIPSGLTATAGNTQVSLSWTAAAYAASYNVKRATVSGGPYTTVGNSSSTSFTDTSLTNGVTYYYVVTGVNAGGESGNSGQASATPFVSPFNNGFETPAIGTNNYQYNPGGSGWTFTGASPNGSGIVANGSAFLNPTSPQGTQAAFVQQFGTVTQAISGFVPGNVYRIKFKAAERPGNSQTWIVKIDNTMIGSYNPGVTATSYADYTTSTFTATAVTHTLAFVGTNQALGDNTVFIDNVLIELVPPPSPPTNLTATGGNTQVSLIWTASPGATSYNVKRATISGGPYTTVGSPTTNSFTNTGLTNGTTYYYVVTALNGEAESGVSNQASATPQVPAPSAPTNLTATGGDTQVSLSWNASSGATSYNVKRAAVSGGPYTTVGNPTSNSFTNTGLTNGTTYYYVVTAVNAGGESGISNQASATPQVPAPQAPTNLTATGGNTQVSLSWTSSSGATSYNVKRATVSGGPYTTVGSPTSNSFTNTGLTNGTTYYYVVTAVNAGGESGISNQSSATPQVPAPSAPTGLIANAGDTQVSLIWSATSGATSYNVKRATISGGPYTTVGSPASNSFTNTGLTNGTTYYYVVTAVNAGGESGVSNQASATPQVPAPSAPTGLAATGGDTQVGLSWTAASGATSYNVKRATVSGGPYTTVASPTSNSFTNTGLTNGTTYYYVVTAMNAGGESGTSNQASATPQVPAPSAPAGLSATGGDTQVALSWTAAPGATSYNVKRATISGGPYTTVASPTSNSFTNTGLPNGTTYYYVVTAVNAGGESGISNQASATPQVPTPSAPTGLAATGGDTQVALSWTAASSATSYNVKRATVSGGPYTTVGSPTSNNFTNTGLTNGTTYYYIVTAVNAGGESNASNEASAKPAGAPYETWMDAYPSIAPADRNPSADPDHDGVPNGIEFLTGSSPASPGGPASLSATMDGSGNLVLHFKRVDAAKAYPVAVESSSDPQSTWAATMVPNEAVAGPPVTVVENGAAPDDITVVIPADGQPRKFARLRIEIPSAP